jgi:hypothetical protein
MALEIEKKNREEKRKFFGLFEIRKTVALFFFLASLSILYLPGLIENIEQTWNPIFFNDDGRQQTPIFYSAQDPETFTDDYIVAYYRALLPSGFMWVYTQMAHIVDPIIFGNYMQYGLYTVFLFSIFLASFRLGGGLGSWATLFLVFSSGLALDLLWGGLARSYGLPILAAALAFLIYGRTLPLIFLTLFGAAFYPVSGLLVGSTLFLTWFVLPQKDRGDSQDWCFRKRLTLILITFFLSVLLLIPTVVSTKKYGPLLTQSDCPKYIEIGTEGRYKEGSICAKSPPLLIESTQISGMMISNRNRNDGSSWSHTLRQLGKFKLRVIPGLSRDALLAAPFVILTLIVSGFLAIKRPEVRRAFMLLATSCLGYIASQWVIPYGYLPNRYVAFSLPILFVVFLPTALLATPALLKTRLPFLWLKNRQAGAALLFSSLLLIALFMGGSGKGASANHSTISTDQQPIFQYIAALPKDVMVAGWPRGMIKTVPFLTKRKNFISYETHQVFHEAFLLKMRERMYALIDGYLATTPGPLIKLRDQYGVTHLVVNMEDYGERRARYFEPFNRYIQEKYDQNEGAEYEVVRQLMSGTVISSGPYKILDLSLIK